MKIRNGVSLEEASLRGAETNKKKHQARIDKYNLNPSTCKFCNYSLPYKKRKNKFCGHSCSASFNNLGVIRNFKERTYEDHIKVKKDRNKNCLFCDQETFNFKFCSIQCHLGYKKKIRRERIEENDSLINYKKDKWYLVEIRGHICEECKNVKWNGEDIPIDTHHKDGDNDNNKLDNVLLICPNCHRQTDNYGSKNKTNSKRKQYRKDRYDKGLSY